MDWRELIEEAWFTLTLNKMRTGLATLGIVIGIGSVIALISLGQSSQKSVQNQIQSLGSNLLTVIPGGSMTGNVRGAAGGGITLTMDDAEAFLTSSKVNTVKTISPELSRRSQVTAGRNNTNTQVIGVTSEYATVRKILLANGVFISSRDNQANSKLAVLGPQVVTDLFGEGASPIGTNIRIEGQAFKVIGVTTAKGGSGFNNQDDVIYIPLSTAQNIVYGINYLSSISVEAINDKSMELAREQIGYLLLERHKIKDPLKADFSIFSQNDVLGAASSITGTFTALLSGIAAISLLVGGIGIMNIMLVTVTERTREIGLRKALGAKRKVIVIQFLIESIIVTVVGGILGIALGVLISAILSKVMNLPFAISWSSMIMAVGVSGFIGVIFGWYPARKAAELQPIEALRYE